MCFASIASPSSSRLCSRTASGMSAAGRLGVERRGKRERARGRERQREAAWFCGMPSGHAGRGAR